jgi:hypothetical protein
MASAGRWYVRGSAVGVVGHDARGSLTGAPSSGLWPLAGHRAAVVGPREEESKSEERDGRRDRLVSERAREGECARASGPRGLALLGQARADGLRAQARASARC